MPVGPFPTFDACVLEIQSQGNSEDEARRICGALERETKSQTPPPSSKPFNGKRLIVGLDIFSTGTHTDSLGNVREWTMSDLEAMVSHFQADEVTHVKLGHTSPEFIALVAKKLGVEKEFVTGDGEGNGQISLGNVVRLYIEGEKMKGDLVVPEALADVIDKDLLVQVSAEIILDEKEGPTLDAVALLGAERQAVEDLDGLASAATLQKPKARTLVNFYSYKRHILQYQTGGSQMDLKDLLNKLNLQDHATEEEALTVIERVMAALNSLKEMLGEGAPEEMSAESVKAALKAHVEGVTKVSFQKGAESKSPDVAKFSELVKTQGEQLATLQLENRVIKFTRDTTPLVAVDGTPEEKAQKLAKLSDEDAAARLKEWRHTQNLGEKAGLFQRIGSLQQGEITGNPSEEFEKAVDVWMKAHEDKSRAEAYKAVMNDQPALYAAYDESIKVRPVIS